MIKLVCWNIAKNHDPWRCLVKNEIRADIALLQEATMPPEDVDLEVDPAPFRDPKTGKGLSRCAIVKLSDRVDVKVKYLTPVPLGCAQDGDFKTTHPGCLAAAIITPPDGDSFYAVSFCPEYEKPHRCTGKMAWDIVDASVHRVISDLSLLIGRQRGHRIIAAGDLTIYHGFGEDKGGFWKGRYDTVFNRMAALGLPFVGPQHPHGRQADPWPPELPEDSKNVPTYCKEFRQNPAAAVHQLDYVFASESMADSVKVRALNRPEEWGPSDHCRIEIEVE